MLNVVIIFLCASLLLYLLLGGADFGAGIIEMFTSAKNKSRTRRIAYRAIGPVWEANHMWLIIFIVVLFVGFPDIYATMTTYLHIPLLLMLLGIILRGTAFIFRHYDAVKDNMQVVYNKIFVYSSFITPLLLGMIAGAVIAGRINPDADNFYMLYVSPWFNWFCFAVGLFTVALCGFLAAIYLVGEASSPYDEKRFIRKAGVINLLTIAAGALVFITARLEGLHFWSWLFMDPVGRYMIFAALLSLAVLWYYLLKGRRKILLRLLAGFQVTMILLAIGYHNFPDFMILGNGEHLSLLQHTAPEATLKSLGWALLAGSVLILPFLGYLFYSFQRPSQEDIQSGVQQ
jgi:cytochrome d ubiquinol oxidase subunit II